jgi:lysozyme
MMTNAPYEQVMSTLEAEIANDEGFRENVYRCPAGKLTIGYGYNISAGMPKDEALVLMRYRLSKIDYELQRRFKWYNDATDEQKRALINMAYQMGVPGLSRFSKMLSAASAGDWDLAAEMALDSKWAQHDSPARAKRVAEMLRG